jgi:malate dehydrogenase (oxaloacetate-decarboxylating)(NADP+)
MVKRDEADAMICGAVGQFHRHLKHLLNVLELEKGVTTPFTLSAVVLPSGIYFISDCYVAPNPEPGQIAEMTLRSAAAVRRFGVEPQVALLSSSNFGSFDTPAALRMREALRIVIEREPSLEVDGEMNADVALQPEIRQRLFPNSRLKGSANLLIMPDVDAANIALNIVKSLGGGLAIGPMLLGLARPAHVLTASTTVRGLVNMTAIAVCDAQAAER